MEDWAVFFDPPSRELISVEKLIVNRSILEVVLVVFLEIITGGYLNRFNKLNFLFV